MMFKLLSLISLFFLFVDNTSGTSPPPMTSSSMAVSDAKMSLSSQTRPNSKATSNFQITPIFRMSPNSKTTWNPKITKKTAVTTKIATIKNTVVTSGCTTLKPMGNIHFLFYGIFLLFYVQSG